MTTGSYVGGFEESHVEVGFEPAVVIVKGDDNHHGVIRTATMPAGFSKRPSVSAAMVANRITGFDATGFSVGSDVDVSAPFVNYTWIAFSADEFTTLGTYVGNGAERTIDIGQEPDYVIVLGEDGTKGVHKASSLPGSISCAFDDQCDYPLSVVGNQIKEFVPNGFNLGTNARVNQNGKTYHYVAWKINYARPELKRRPLNFNVGLYDGNGKDRKNIRTRIKPEYTLLQKVDLLGPEVLHRVRLPGRTPNLADPMSMSFQAHPNRPDRIIQMRNGSFRVGSHTDVNKATATYFWVAFKQDLPAAP